MAVEDRRSSRAMKRKRSSHIVAIIHASMKLEGTVYEVPGTAPTSRKSIRELRIPDSISITILMLIMPMIMIGFFTATSTR